MAEKKPLNVGVRARVRVTIDIGVPSHWGGDCPVSQVHDQAITDARSILGKAFANHKDMCVVGDVEVMSTIVDTKR